MSNPNTNVGDPLATYDVIEHEEVPVGAQVGGILGKGLDRLGVDKVNQTIKIPVAYREKGTENEVRIPLTDEWILDAKGYPVENQSKEPNALETQPPPGEFIKFDTPLKAKIKMDDGKTRTVNVEGMWQTTDEDSEDLYKVDWFEDPIYESELEWINKKEKDNNGNELDRKGFPKKAIWTTLHGDGQVNADVLGKYPDGTYEIEAEKEIDGRKNHKVPEEELEFIDSTEADEGPKDKEIRELKERIEQLEELVRKLQKGEADDPPGPLPTVERARAEEALSNIRDQLIEVTIRRQARVGDSLLKARKEDAETYEKLMGEYKQALTALMKIRKNELVAEGSENQEIHKQLALMQYEEEQLFTNAKFDKNIELSKDTKWGRFLLKWANYSTKKKLLIGAAVGVAGFAAASSTVGIGLFGLAAGSAARFSLGLVNKKASAINVSEKARAHELSLAQKAYEDYLNKIQQDADLETLESALSDTSGEFKDKRVSRAQLRNKIGTGVLVLSGLGVTFGGLEAAGVHIPPFDRIPSTNGKGIFNDILNNNDGGGSGSSSGGEVFSPNGPTGSEGTGGGSAFNPEGSTGGDPGSLSLDNLNVNPDTITARNMTEFQQGVVGLLERQGIHTSNLTPNAVRQLNEYMMNRPMASGMSGTGQNLIEGQGIFTNPSYEQGFAIGADGTGRKELLNWMAAAQKSGVTFSR